MAVFKMKATQYDNPQSSRLEGYETGKRRVRRRLGTERFLNPKEGMPVPASDLHFRSDKNLPSQPTVGIRKGNQSRTAICLSDAASDGDRAWEKSLGRSTTCSWELGTGRRSEARKILRQERASFSLSGQPIGRGGRPCRSRDRLMAENPSNHAIYLQGVADRHCLLEGECDAAGVYPR